MDIFFNVLHYNSFKATSMCVDSLLGLDNIKNSKILIFDNNSNNDSFKQLEERYKECENIILFHNSNNDGFSKGMNKAYKMAKAYGPQFIICLNNDIEIKQKDFIDRLHDIYDKTDAYLIGPDIYNPREKKHQSPMYSEVVPSSKIDKLIEGRKKEMENIDAAISLYQHSEKMRKYRNLIPSKLLEIRNKRKGEDIITLYKEKELQGTVLQGSCLIFTKKYIEKEEVCFEPDTGFYAEELLLSLKCKTLKYDTVYSSDIKVIHWHGISSGFKSVPSRDALITKNERLIHAYEVYKDCYDNNPWA